MKKVLCFGAGEYYRNNIERIRNHYEVVAICDNASQKWGQSIDGVIICNPTEITQKPFLDVMITCSFKYEVIQQLVDMGVNTDRIHFINDKYEDEIIAEDGGKICRHYDGLSILLSDSVEEMIFEDIFLREDYNVNSRDDSILIDIGQNVGLASLYFLNKPFIRRVYAYEPDARLWEKAKKNISINGFENKIEMNLMALSDKNEELTYSIPEGGSFGIRMQRQADISDGLRTVMVDCVDVYSVLGNVIKRHYGKESIIIKCDCEGAEYRIFDRLENTGLLDMVDVVIMEWHLGKRGDMEQLFKRNGFYFMANSSFSGSLSNGELRAEDSANYFRRFLRSDRTVRWAAARSER